MKSQCSTLASCVACNSDAVIDVGTSNSAPCCDETCLENIARRECISQCTIRETSDCGTNSRGILTQPDWKIPANARLSRRSKGSLEACGTHLRSVNARYLSILKSLGCICKELIAQNLEPCCRLRGERSPGREPSTSSFGSRRSKEGCCRVGKSEGEASVSLFGSSKEFGNCTGSDKRDCGSGDCDEYCTDRKNSRVTSKKGDYTIDSGSECCNIMKGTDCAKANKKSCNGGDRELDCCPTAKCASTNLEVKQNVRELKCAGQNAKDTCSSKKDETTCSINESCYDNCFKPEASTCTGGSCCIKEAYGILNPAPPRGATCNCKDSQFIRGLKSDCCAIACQSSKEEATIPAELNGNTADYIDIEKGIGTLEHVVLDVGGLTCVGCETKLYKSIQVISGIRNLRTSLVLSQAEFDLDLGAGSVTEVIKSIELATGFTCQKLSNEGHDIDVIVDGSVEAFTAREYPKGVLQMIVSDKQTVKITYDPKVVGARALVERSFDAPLKLAVDKGSCEMENGRKHVKKTALVTISSAVLTIPVLIMAWAPLHPRPIAYGSASLALATLVQFVIAGPFYPSALKALVFTRVIEMDLLIVLSTSAAYVFSVISFVYQVVGRPLSTGGFFETSTLLVTLIMLGRLVSAFARQRAVQSVSVRALQMAVAVICDADGKGERQIDARLLQYGDFFRVIPDSRIPTDGVIVQGGTEIDESMITGESFPVEKGPGAFVRAGSLNLTGVLLVRLTHLPGDNTISTIAAMVDEAKFSKPKIQALVDIIAGFFVPVILFLTIITFVIWVVVGIFGRHQNVSHAVVDAVTYGISVLIVSCPCAVGLAVPMVVVIAGGVAAKHGVIFKSAMAIEIARKTTHVIFDKTGTLTQGEMSVAEEVYLSKDVDLAASITLGLTSDSKHPVSIAVSDYLKRKGVSPAKISNPRLVVGKGIEDSYEGLNVRCGNVRWLSAGVHPEVQNLVAQGLTVFCMAVENRVLVAFGLSDSLRPESYAVVNALQKRGIVVSVVSGDDTRTVERVGIQLGIHPANLRSNCTPGDKEEYIKALLTADERQTIIFCGDGTNDAVAIARATVGVHMNSGSDIAQTAADVVLTRPCLNGILVLIDLSHAAFRRISFNFAWSFVYNLFAITLASGAFVYARISPQYAGLGEIVSVLPVILIALQLRSFKREC